VTRVRIRLVDCKHIPGFRDADRLLVEVPAGRGEYEFKGAHMALASQVFRLKRTHALDADGEPYFLDAPEYAPVETLWPTGGVA
jgi:hypothetical protein